MQHRCRWRLGGRRLNIQPLDFGLSCRFAYEWIYLDFAENFCEGLELSFREILISEKKHEAIVPRILKLLCHCLAQRLRQVKTYDLGSHCRRDWMNFKVLVGHFNSALYSHFIYVFSNVVRLTHGDRLFLHVLRVSLGDLLNPVRHRWMKHDTFRVQLVIEAG